MRGPSHAPLYSARVFELPLPLPWAVRALVQRPLDPAEELLEVLMREAEPLVAQWARGLRGRARNLDALVDEIVQLEVAGGPVARLLAASVRQAWGEFSAVPLPDPT